MEELREKEWSCFVCTEVCKCKTCSSLLYDDDIQKIRKNIYGDDYDAVMKVSLNEESSPQEIGDSQQESDTQTHSKLPTHPKSPKSFHCEMEPTPVKKPSKSYHPQITIKTDLKPKTLNAEAEADSPSKNTNTSLNSVNCSINSNTGGSGSCSKSVHSNCSSDSIYLKSSSNLNINININQNTNSTKLIKVQQTQNPNHDHHDHAKIETELAAHALKPVEALQIQQIHSTLTTQRNQLLPNPRKYVKRKKNTSNHLPFHIPNQASIQNIERDNPKLKDVVLQDTERALQIDHFMIFEDFSTKDEVVNKMDQPNPPLKDITPKKRVYNGSPCPFFREKKPVDETALAKKKKKLEELKKKAQRFPSLRCREVTRTIKTQKEHLIHEQNMKDVNGILELTNNLERNSVPHIGRIKAGGGGGLQGRGRGKVNMTLRSKKEKEEKEEEKLITNGSKQKNIFSQAYFVPQDHSLPNQFLPVNIMAPHPLQHLSQASQPNPNTLNTINTPTFPNPSHLPSTNPQIPASSAPPKNTNSSNSTTTTNVNNNARPTLPSINPPPLGFNTNPYFHMPHSNPLNFMHPHNTLNPPAFANYPHNIHNMAFPPMSFYFPSPTFNNPLYGIGGLPGMPLAPDNPPYNFAPFNYTIRPEKNPKLPIQNHPMSFLNFGYNPVNFNRQVPTYQQNTFNVTLADIKNTGGGSQQTHQQHGLKKTEIETVELTDSEDKPSVAVIDASGTQPLQSAGELEQKQEGSVEISGGGADVAVKNSSEEGKEKDNIEINEAKGTEREEKEISIEKDMDMNEERETIPNGVELLEKKGESLNENKDMIEGSKEEREVELLEEVKIGNEVEMIIEQAESNEGDRKPDTILEDKQGEEEREKGEAEIAEKDLNQNPNLDLMKDTDCCVEKTTSLTQ